MIDKPELKKIVYEVAVIVLTTPYPILDSGERAKTNPVLEHLLKEYVENYNIMKKTNFVWNEVNQSLPDFEVPVLTKDASGNKLILKLTTIRKTTTSEGETISHDWTNMNTYEEHYEVVTHWAPIPD